MWNLDVSVIVLLGVTVGMVGSFGNAVGLVGKSSQLQSNNRKARYAQFIIPHENEDGCKALNTSCESHSDCCGGDDLCVGTNDDNSVCKKCKGVGQDCNATVTECCQSFPCKNGKCVCFQDGETCSGHGTCCGRNTCIGRSTTGDKTCSPCGTTDSPCDDKYGCCSGRCSVEEKVCYCTLNGIPCASNLECCSDFGLRCLNRVCQICVQLNGACANDGECCSKNCAIGVCGCKRKLSRKKRCTFTGGNSGELVIT